MTTAGSAAPSRASARAARSRTWWPTPGRRRRCAARWTRCLTPPLTARAGCFSPRPPLAGSPSGLGPPGPEFGFGRWLVTARAPGPGQHRPGRRDQRTFGRMFIWILDRCYIFFIACDIALHAISNAISHVILHSEISHAISHCNIACDIACNK